MNPTEFEDDPKLRPSHVLLNLILEEEAEREGWKSKFLAEVRRAFGLEENIIPFPASRVVAFREVQHEQQERFAQAAASGERLIPVYRIEESFFYSSEPEEISWLGSAGWGGAAETGEGYLATLILGDELEIAGCDDLLLFYRRDDEYCLQKMSNEGSDPLTGPQRNARTSLPVRPSVLDLEVGGEGLLAPCLLVQAQTRN